MMEIEQTLSQNFETIIDEFTFGRRPSSGRTATSFLVNVIVISGGVLSCVVRQKIISLSIFLSMFYIADYESPIISSTYEGTLHRS